MKHGFLMIVAALALGGCVGPNYVPPPTRAAVDDATSRKALQVANAEIADPDDRIVCKREHVVGSNRPQKVCMTVRQQKELRARAAEVYKNGDRPAERVPLGGV